MLREKEEINVSVYVKPVKVKPNKKFTPIVLALLLISIILIVPWARKDVPKDHIFYFKQVPYTGRDTELVVWDLTRLNLPGMAGSIGQLLGVQKAIDGGNSNLGMRGSLLGRQFEADRAIYYADKHMLESMNVSAPHYDLIIFNHPLGIRYVECKFSFKGLRDKVIIDTIISARTHESGTYLMEFVVIDSYTRRWLIRAGGIEIPNE